MDSHTERRAQKLGGLGKLTTTLAARVTFVFPCCLYTASSRVADSILTLPLESQLLIHHSLIVTSGQLLIRKHFVYSGTVRIFQAEGQESICNHDG